MTVNYFPKNSRVFYFWKGRVALYGILKALGIGSGDEVIMPGFTCVVVPNAVLYLGAIPIYADIEPDTYNLSTATIEPLITDRTRVILAQNTFGLSADLDPIMDLAQEHDIVVVEDCAHGLGGLYKGKRNGTVAHAAFFSTQWSKPISTGLGGIAYVRGDTLAKRTEQIVREMPRPNLVDQALLLMQLLVRPVADHPTLHYASVDLYRFITQNLNLPVGSSTGDELTSTEMPSEYAKRMGRLQLWNWKRGLKKLDVLVKQRRNVAKHYDAFFSSHPIEPPYRPDYAMHAMLRYTIRVPNKHEVLDRAKEKRIPVGDWFLSPLHPVVGDLSPWGYQIGQCPVAEQACRETVNLFTDRALSRHQLAALFSTEQRASHVYARR